jgi:hypothetical protein
MHYSTLWQDLIIPTINQKTNVPISIVKYAFSFYLLAPRIATLLFEPFVQGFLYCTANIEPLVAISNTKFLFSVVDIICVKPSIFNRCSTLLESVWAYELRFRYVDTHTILKCLLPLQVTNVPHFEVGVIYASTTNTQQWNGFF